ncbi:MAG: alginate O-acetyltransferase [Methylocystis sp.]
MRVKLDQKLPILACIGLVISLFIIAIWNFIISDAWPNLRIRSASPLAGIAKVRPIPWSWANFIAGETQKAASVNFSQRSPVFPISVRAKNQFIFSLFHESAAAGVMIGKNDQLYEQFYINEFCGRLINHNLTNIPQWGESLQQIQSGLEKLGKKFVYVITPSKAAQYPEDLPPAASCAKNFNSIPDKLTPYVNALGDRHIHIFNGADLIHKKRQDYSVPLFPRGGTHWNSLAAGLALQEINQLTAFPFGSINFSWRPALQAEGTDRDLLDLLNLLWPDATYPTTVITNEISQQSCSLSPRLLAMGGSFLHEILAAATLAQCPPQIDYWFYMRPEDLGVELGHYWRKPGEAGNGERQSADETVLDANVRNADVVILEENESNIATMKQVDQLKAALRRIQ